MEKIKDFFKNKQFFKTLIILALPIILQNILTSSLNMADTLMIGSIGDEQVAAVGIFTKDLQVIKEASSYLAIVSISYIVTAITFTIATALRCMEDSKTPMIISAVAVCINIVLNYIFIFGKFGVPEMGVQGAAIATVIARFVECTLLAIKGHKHKVLHGEFKEYFMFKKDFAFSIYKSVILVVLNEACWGFGTFFYSIAYGKLGTESMAAVQITNNIQNLFFVVCFSMASSSLVMIGNLMYHI
ncbi:MATE family efflux transporter [Clostridium chauvoei]|uniref:Probable multidrug resistance protein NorM n=2 Tax=Clostridium chauvoei TaxID=46867 RepID=S6F0Q3_9CLOT|nr:MATE family efflux transporter [Clostridium chauvoei]ATD55461.1 hypothetical protein BTM20_09535 [Clostridium chauvoei]ATD56866.1 hypothetical protein BTM21_03500 [Clostridium chauvoei]MBX7280676.1 polysaccharide biosynthesis C-terminal domain-containing protein [Clostridium chauvoei]MBX7283160.1 polysaccharide biosynthesis C-terminal domain-containing protein [Clostridium chauvoei]MBX7285717.1 polysaccharide biosynthesis C-terminal domain-containing protein [Clostridium chauvoei]